ncbi:hypothetical protein V8F20_002491 [Naviculisporaceae sp. PSN 640]
MKLQIVDPVWSDKEFSSLSVEATGSELDLRHGKGHDDGSSPTATIYGTEENGESWLLRRRTLELGILQRFRGWSGALLLLCILSWALTASILGISISLSTRGGITDGSITTVTIQTGSCDDINSADMWIHLVMNILSSSLLAATNFAMQAWSAPTRHDVDKAHSKCQTVNIGIPSLSNMLQIRPVRLVLWTSMFVVALPLHFVFNSAIYKTSSVNLYANMLVTPEHMETTLAENKGNWEELPVRDLLQRYCTELPMYFRHAMFVWDMVNQTQSIVAREMIDSGTILMPQLRVPPSIHDEATEPEFGCGRFSVDTTVFFWDSFRLRPTAFSEKFEPECRLLANPLFWWLTSLCSLTIACCLTGMVYFHNSTVIPLVTVGDALDSFLTRPSESIKKSACSYDHTAFRNMFRPSLIPKKYQHHRSRRRWWQAVGLTRWALTTLWFSCIILALVACFIAGMRSNVPFDIKKLLSPNLGSELERSAGILGQATPTSMTKEFRLVTIANAPQFITSFTYVYYNCILTTMVAEREWHRIGTVGKGSSSYPRVSNPRGSQRSSYFLSLPYRYAIPLFIITTAEKWLASLGLFYLSLDMWDSEGNKMVVDDSLVSDGSLSTLGYSSPAIFWLIILTAISWLGIVLLGIVRSYPAGKPLMGTCSAVIAAACHLSTADSLKQRDAGKDLAAGKLSWGVIKQVNQEGEVEQWLGFMSGKEAEMPVDDEVYG